MVLNYFLFIFFSTVFIFPQSFSLIKFPLLIVILLLILFNYRRGNIGLKDISVLIYYTFFTLLVALWLFVGMVRENSNQALVDAVRVYIIFMWVYAALTIYISNRHYQKYMVSIFSFSALMISFFCFFVFFNHFYNLNFISDYIKNEMLLEVGIHAGFVQINSVNIGMFCFLIPFMFSMLILNGRNVGWVNIIVLFISVVAVMLASRRIVLVLIVLTPLLTYFIYKLSNGKQRGVGARTLISYAILTFLVLAMLAWLYGYNEMIFNSFTNRILDIFVADPESPRQLQFIALKEGFFKYPIIGSGFGGVVDVVRSDERPWTYELTYSRLLFNSGLVGGVVLVFFFLSFFVLVIRKMRGVVDHKNTYVSLMVGFMSVMVASLSNPYLSSFDFIFVLSIIPLILNSKENVAAIY